MALDYIILGSMLGRRFIFIIIGFIASLMLYGAIYVATDNQVLAGTLAGLFFALTAGYVIYRAYQDNKRKMADVRRKEQEMRGLADSVRVDKNKCLSCLSPLESGQPYCPNCGYDNSRNLS